MQNKSWKNLFRPKAPTWQFYTLAAGRPVGRFTVKFENDSRNIWKQPRLLQQRGNTKYKGYWLQSICGVYSVCCFLASGPGPARCLPTLPVYSFFSPILGTLCSKQALHVMPEKKEPFNILGHAFPPAPLSQLFKGVKRIWQCLGFGNVG